jgi:hypothetical protein
MAEVTYSVDLGQFGGRIIFNLHVLFYVEQFMDQTYSLSA